MSSALAERRKLSPSGLGQPMGLGWRPCRLADALSNVCLPLAGNLECNIDQRPVTQNDDLVCWYGRRRLVYS